MTARDPLANEIYRILLPLFGETMADSSLSSQCAALGVNEAHLSAAELPLLAERLRRAMVIFLGKAKAEEVARSIEGLRT
jgi:hypothetical protein